MVKYFYTIILFAFIVNTAVAQTEHLDCGTETPESIHKFMADYYESDLKFKNDSTLYLPITAHIFRRSDGSGGLTQTQLYDAIEAMNVFYANADIQFFICGGINYVDNSNYYDFRKGDESTVGQQYDVKNTINIYFANSVTSAHGDPLCGYAYYPGGPDRILMNNSCAINGSTLSHEMGHFFSLIHTHGTSNSRLTNELVNGSNCQIAGDKICDTPADPQLSYSNVTLSCIYTGNTIDRNGHRFEPDPENIMSYARKECRIKFTEEQYNVIHYTSRTVRNYFACPGSLELTLLPDNQFCGGSETDIMIYADNIFDPSNTFSVELSDAKGNFNNAEVIGTFNGTSTGLATIKFPNPATTSNGHRVRVVSSSPLIFSNDNGTDITLNASPDLYIKDSTLCETDVYDLTTAFVDNADVAGKVTYWLDTGATTILPQPHAINSSGKYFVKKMAYLGRCEVTEDVDVEFVASPGTPVVTLEGNMLVSSIETGNQWYNLDGPIEGATGQTFQPEYNSHYWVEVSHDICPTGTSAEFSYNISEKPAPLHPNPVRDVLYINHKPTAGNAVYRIVDIRGRTIDAGELSPQSQQRFHVQSIGRGMYILEINDNGVITHSKFMKL